MTGTVSLAMTVDTLWIGKTPTIAVSVKGISAKNALHTVAVVTKPFAQVVPSDVPTVKKISVRIV